ncbi:MAG TPA: MFS transporter, partial [bacterium]|nr:MFS transporter [bacterium]
WALVCFCFIFAKNYPAIIMTFVLYGLHKGANEPSQKAFVSELAPENYRATCLGSFQMVTGIAALPASLMAGGLWEKLGMRIPFYFSLVLKIAAIVMLFFVSPQRKLPRTHLKV